jgi:two-component system, OmpR family, sensor histidine kinase KdpD
MLVSVLGRLRSLGWAKEVLVALLAPASATALALALQPGRALGAISIFLLGVVVAAALAGIRSGLAASVLSFLSLNYFFTEPLHTFRVTDSEDVVALLVFLIVAGIVGSLVARALEERSRAARGERESRLLSYFATKVLSGEPLDQVLGDFAGALLGTLRLARCEIRVRAGNFEHEVVRTRDGGPEGAATEIPVEGGGQMFGVLSVRRATGRPPIEGDDLRLLESAARQMVVALERARLDAQVVTARLDAETNEARAALFSSVTHDLRTPLATIKAGITSLLEEDAEHDDARRRELLEMVLEETDRLNRLLGNLLDLARIEAGALVPAKEPVAIDEIVETVLHRMERRFGSVRVRTQFRDAPEVAADPVQIDQVVTNLLENAIRFSPDGGEVTVSVVPWKDSVQVRVTDRGPGIAPDQRGRVFEAFYRGDADGRSGSGLGLAIARAIVLAHGGRIRAEGSPAGGASVVVELPAIEPSRITAPRSGTAPSSAEP